MDRKRMKKLISILTVAAIFTMSFAGAFSVSAEGALYTISTDDVAEAILYDHAEGVETPENVVGGNDYDVAPSLREDGKIEVAITATGVKLHKNDADSPAYGYWVGFAVKAPEGAAKAIGNFGAPYEEAVTDIDGNGTNGIAFYINAGVLNPKTEATLQWLTESDEALCDVTIFEIDLDAVTLGVEYELDEEKIGKAIIDDTANLGTRGLYATYDVSYADGVVSIAMEKLELHKNGENTSGFWTGFSVEAPDNADFAKYTFGDEIIKTENVSVNIDGEGANGIAFYTDAANPKRTVKLQWFEGAAVGENSALSNPIELTINLDGVEYYKVDAENDITEAILYDHTEGVETPENVVGGNDYDAAPSLREDGKIEVAITATGVKLHKNDADSPAYGYWVGFAVKAPEGAAKAIGNFGAPYEEAVTDIDGNGTGGIAFYINAGDANPKTTSTLQWLDENGETLSDVTTFEINLDNVTLDVIDYTPEIVKANIADYDEERPVYDADSYELDTETTPGVVAISMTGLKEHTREGNVEGYWTGFAVEAPTGATQFKYAFGADKENLVWVEGLGGLLHGLEDIDGAEGEKVGVAFITDANNTPKKYAMLQWFDNDGNAVTDIVEFEMNLDNVKLNWIKADKVSAATPRSGEVAPQADPTQNDDVINVVLTAENVRKHYNEDTTPEEGYWVGFEVEAPSEAAKMKYAFGVTDELTLGAIKELETISENKKGIAFYTNAGAVAPKLYAMLQWFANDETTPLCAPTKVVIDISEVTLAEIPYITADKVQKANVVDQANTSVQPYGTYSAVGAANENGVIVVDIDMTDLKSHLSDGAGTGYWTGFSVTAPDGAVSMRYAFSHTREGLSSMQKADLNGENQVSFYANKADAQPKKFVRLQWFDENGVAITNATDFEMDLSGVSLYVAPQPPRGGGGGSVNYCTVSFNSNGGSVVSSAKVKKEGTVSAPAVPIKDGFVFEGWYTDKELTQKYDFSTLVTKSFTLYAKWTEKDAEATTGLKFTDIKKDAWYYDVVKTIVEKGLMNGISETEFAPEKEVTRAMFVTILYRAAEEPKVAAGTNFTDVAADQYYAKAVAWANANGIVKGISETEFAPDNNITREQMAVILYRYKKAQKTDKTTNYADENSISEYAFDAINWANAQGIMNGNEDGTFAPLRNSSRAEAAAVFVRLLNL